MNIPSVYMRYKHQREHWRLNERLSEYVNGHRLPINILLRLMVWRDRTQRYVYRDEAGVVTLPMGDA